MGITINIRPIMEARFDIKAIFVMILFLICNSRSVITGHFNWHCVRVISVFVISIFLMISLSTRIFVHSNPQNVMILKILSYT